MQSHKLGKDGEAFAFEFLLRHGYQVIEVNYRTRSGEIDMIAKEGGVVCFIEVKTRQEDGWDAFEAVDWRKQGKIRRVAEQYLVEQCGTVDVASRFDVLGVYPMPGGGFEAVLLKDAFGI